MLENVPCLPYRSFCQQQNIFFPSYTFYTSMILLAFLCKKIKNYIVSSAFVHYVPPCSPSIIVTTENNYRSFRQLEFFILPDYGG